MGDRGFTPQLSGVEDLTIYIFELWGARRVEKFWACRFVKQQPELKTRFNRVYNFNELCAKIQ